MEEWTGGKQQIIACARGTRTRAPYRADTTECRVRVVPVHRVEGGPGIRGVHAHRSIEDAGSHGGVEWDGFKTKSEKS